MSEESTPLITYEGFLIKVNPGNITIPIKAAFGSKYSLYVDAIDGNRIRDGERYNKMLLNINGKEYDFGKCVFYLDYNDLGFPGRVIFLNDIYDFKKLFFKQQFVNLETLTNDLEVILDQKAKIRQEFRDYINDFIYDLKVYKYFFDELDRKFSSEPEQVKEIVLHTIINREGRKFMVFFNQKLKQMEEIVVNYTKEEQALHGFYLRKQLWDIISCSAFMMRTNLKPRGYAGDSLMMRMIYENNYIGDSTFSKILYKISLEHPAAQAVRNRRAMIARMIKTRQAEMSVSEGKLKFMSVACGCAYELQDLFISEEDLARYECTLFDQDSEALKEAKINVSNIEKKIGYKIDVSYIEDSVRTMLRSSDTVKQWGSYDFIYSMGMFDYLTPPVAKAVMTVMYSLLEPGGLLLVGNFHVSNQSRWFMEFWHDWVLYYRTEDEFLDLLQGIPAQDVRVIFEDSGSQMFLTARKPL